MEAFPLKAAQLAEVMTQAGLHCIGCHASPFESLEQGILGHGYSEESLNAVVVKLNEIVEEPDPQAVARSDQDGMSPLALTPAAVERARELMKKEGKEGWGLRVSVKTGGCAGFSYDLDFKEKPEMDDLVLRMGELDVYVDRLSLDMLQGMEIDFVMGLKESGFRFKNPKAQNTCGCGESFN